MIGGQTVLPQSSIDDTHLPPKHPPDPFPVTPCGRPRNMRIESDDSHLKIRAGPEWQKRNDTGRKSSNIANVFLLDLMWYVYCINCNTDKILFLNCQQSYGSFAAFMRDCWNICVENENFASDFFERSVKREIWNIWFGNLNKLIPKKNTRMLWIDYFWY